MLYQSIRIQIAIITKLINNTKFKIDKGDHLLDTHTHILWNIDDGSKNQCMSLQMLEIAARSGTKAIFATPHVIERANKPSWEEIKEKTQQLPGSCVQKHRIDIVLLSRSRSADELGAFAGAGSDWRVLFKRR